jgi:Glycosyl transferases group 1
LVVAVGDGPLRTALQAACPDLLFCGARTGEALAAHYASADVFLLPSETETFGNVTLEAMASGLAVVAYDYAAARVHVRSGESGVLVPCGQPDAFVAAAGLAAAPEGLSLLSHPQSVGAVMTIWGIFLAMRFPHADWSALPILETGYYVMGAVLEQGGRSQREADASDASIRADFIVRDETRPG